jgi:hypothetical protein
MNAMARRAILLLAVLVALLGGAGARASLALYTATATLGGNTLTTATVFCTNPGGQTLTASADSYIDQANSGTNYGTATTLNVQAAASSKNQRTLVQFTLPTLPAHCAITAATMRLYATTAKTGRTYQAYQVAAAWTETGVTWTNQPATTGTPATAATASGWVSWTVTTQLQAIYAGSNFGFLVKDATESTTTTYTNKYSSRSGANPPQLVITWG